MTKTIFRTLPFTVLLAALAGLLYFSESVSLAVQEGLTLCYRTIFPSLFPFFVLSTLLISLGFAEALGRSFALPMRVLFRVGGGCAPALFLGLIGGYPVGARTVLTLYQEENCSRGEAERLLAFCNNCGPAFILSIAGGVLQSRKAGVLLYLIHVLSALLTGLLFRRYGEAAPTVRRAKVRSQTPDFIPAFVRSVQSAFSAMLNVCGFVVFFSVLLRPLRHFSQNGLLLGAFELFNGICSLSASDFGFVAAAALLAWGGLSVHCQTLSLLCDSDLDLRPYFLGKLTQTVISGALALLTVRFYPWA